MSGEWLRLREQADARARARTLVERVRPFLPVDRGAVMHDLGCGAGSMGRWLAPQLSGAQHWVMFDQDAALLALAASDPPVMAADGSAVTMEVGQRDITRLPSNDLAGASLVTASALLDLMTADELERMVMTCARAGCPVLVCLSVTDQVELTPSDPLDEPLSEAFNAHQRRTMGGRRLLGPDAVQHAALAFKRQGAEVQVSPSPWRLDTSDPGDAALVAAWLSGWAGAACAQSPALTAATAAYVRRRLHEARSGRLRVTVHHQDLLATPQPPCGGDEPRTHT